MEFYHDNIMNVEHKHTSADGAVGAHSVDPYGVPTSTEQASAQHGAAWATHDHQGGFNYTNGLHVVGTDVNDSFSSAINYSGGVRQCHHYVSDPASGVARANVKDPSLANLDIQDQRSGDTFRDHQSRRVGHRI